MNAFKFAGLAMIIAAASGRQLQGNEIYDPLQPEWNTDATIEEIKANKHYSNESNSRTAYQID